MPFLLASGYYAVVANLAILRYARVVITAVRSQFQKTSGIVTIVAFGIGWYVLVGFTDGPNTVMTLTALAKNF